jgi:hypothetical protein
MSGGTLSGHTGSYGGGVNNMGTFHMETGTIYGSDSPLSNHATNGAAYYSLVGTNERGTISGGTWTSNGSLGNSSDSTINVLNGNLVP